MRINKIHLFSGYAPEENLIGIKNIKIYMQYPWTFPDSPYYKYLVDSPPKGIKYQNISKQRGIIINKGGFWLSNFLKKNIRSWLNKFNLSLPNTHLSPKGDYHLIHCAHCLSKNKNMPWVTDIESYFSLFLSGALNKRTDKKVKKIILGKNCKKILAWTEATKKEILKRIPEIWEKIEVVYPAVPLFHRKKRKSNKKNKLKIVFAARYFWIKGGLVALESLSQLTKKYDLEVIFISDVPPHIRKKYPNIKIFDMVPQKIFWKHLENADIFFYPSFVDTFGFSLLESMSFGVPIITINTNATNACKEIVTDGKTGFVVNALYYTGDEAYSGGKHIGPNEEKIISKLIEKTSELIEDTKLRDSMSKNCIQVIKNGKFSIKKRNKKLEKIYREAIT